MCYEKTDRPFKNIYKTEFYEGTYLETYVSTLRYEAPLGMLEAKKLLYGDWTLDNINYEAIHCHHPASLCCTTFKSNVASILALPNMTNLRKLSLNMCFSNEGYSRSNQMEPLFKRARGNDMMNFEKSTLEKIIDHSPLIEELEIWDCALTKAMNVHGLYSIKKLHRL